MSANPPELSGAYLHIIGVINLLMYNVPILALQGVMFYNINVKGSLHLKLVIIIIIFFSKACNIYINLTIGFY